MTRSEAIEVYKLQHARFQKSQELQWRFNIAMWTLIAAAIYFVDNRTKWPVYKYHCEAILFDLGVLVLVIAFGGSHFLFSKLNQRALGVSKDIWGEILRDLNNNNNQEISVNVKEVSDNFKFSLRDKWWIFFQISATTILLVVLLIVYFQSRP